MVLFSNLKIFQVLFNLQQEEDKPTIPDASPWETTEHGIKYNNKVGIGTDASSTEELDVLGK
eukprot:2951809-Rhodomonas_salina.1